MAKDDSAFRMVWHGSEQMIECGITKREVYAGLIMAGFMQSAGAGVTNKAIDDAADKAALAAEKLAKALSKGGP